MSDSTSTCDLCGDPTRDTTAYVCARCTTNTATHLRSVIAVVGEVETTVAKLARHTDRGGRATEPADDYQRTSAGLKPTALPFNPGASKRGHEASNTIVTWARHAAEERGGGPLAPSVMAGPACRTGLRCKHDSCNVIRDRHVDHPVARAAAYLLGQLDWLRHRPEAQEALQALSAAGATLTRIVDAPPPLWYAGPCWQKLTDQYGHTGQQCESELYAIAGAGTVTCHACKASHDVHDRREWLLKEADDVLAHAALLAAALSVLDRPVTAASIYGLAHRHRITARGVDAHDRPLYRVGEVRAVLADIDYRKTVA